LDVRGFDAEAGEDGADLLAVGVSVVERLDDEHAGFGLVGAFVEDDQPLRIERLGEVTLPDLRVLIGAALLCIAVAALVTSLDDAAAARPRLRLALRGAVVVYLVGSLGTVVWQAPRILSETWAKSGARTLCRAVHFTANDIVVVAPDAIAPEIDYYAGGQPFVAGFPQWERPKVLDMPRQRTLWNRADAAADAARRLDELVRARHPNRVFFVFNPRVEPGPPLQQKEQIERFYRALGQEWRLEPVGLFAGRVETLVAWRLVKP